MSCTQNITRGQDNLFIGYLDNCNPASLYPPARLTETDEFYIVKGRDNTQFSILKQDFEVEIEGDLFTDPNQAIPELLTLIGNVNATVCVPCDGDSNLPIEFETAYIVKDVDELLTIHPADAQNRIPLSESAYYIDSRNFDPGVYTLFIPSSVPGCHIRGFSQQFSKITSSQPNISLIETEGGTNLTISQIKLETTNLPQNWRGFSGAPKAQSSFCKRHGSGHISL